MSEDRVLQPVGQIIDALGARMHLAADDMVTDVLIIAKVMERDGGVRLALAWSEGMSWIERLGMVTAAQASEVPSSSKWRASDDGA